MIKMHMRRNLMNFSLKKSGFHPVRIKKDKKRTKQENIATSALNGKTNVNG
jgi:hypothetical protein